jgi:hypothetical protein
MRAKIEIEIEEEKDGSLMLKYNGMKIGDLNDVKPIDEINEVHDLIKVREKIMSSSKLVNDLNKEIEYRLAKLLAWYYTEY